MMLCFLLWLLHRFAGVGSRQQALGGPSGQVCVYCHMVLATAADSAHSAAGAVSPAAAMEDRRMYMSNDSIQDRTEG